MALIFSVGAIICSHCEQATTPLIAGISEGNMEGEKIRFGTFPSAFYATVTTMASCAVQSIRCTTLMLLPIGGMLPLLGMQLGKVVFGGVGA